MVFGESWVGRVLSLDCSTSAAAERAQRCVRSLGQSQGSISVKPSTVARLREEVCTNAWLASRTRVGPCLPP